MFTRKLCPWYSASHNTWIGVKWCSLSVWFGSAPFFNQKRICRNKFIQIFFFFFTSIKNRIISISPSKQAIINGDTWAIGTPVCSCKISQVTLGSFKEKTSFWKKKEEFD